MTDVLAHLLGQHTAAAAVDEPPGPDLAERSESYYRPDWRSFPFVLTLPAVPVTGAWVLGGARLDFPVRSIRLDNLSGCRFAFSRQAPLYLPPYVVGFVAQTGQVEQVIDLAIDSAGATGAAVLTVFEAALSPSAGIGVGPVAAALQAGAGATQSVTVGAPNTLVAPARPGRVGLVLLNTDPVNAVRLNFDGVSAGSLLGPGASLPLGAYTGPVYATPVSGSPVIDRTETYN
jgi:hypothetical protein